MSSRTVGITTSARARSIRFGELLDQHGGIGPSFGALRLAAAFAVFVAHAPWLATGEYDPLYRISGGQTFLGSVAVGAFFIISGFLVTGSLERCRSVFDYAIRRALRIFPALLVAVAVSALVIGPLFTSLDLKDYFTSRGFWAYFKNAILITRFDLPGVFSDNTFSIVNGSLWTLRYEALCYVFLAACGVSGLLSRRWPVLLIGGLLLLASGLAVGSPREVLDKRLMLPLGDVGSLPIGPLARLLPYFLVGVVAYLWRSRIPLDWRLVGLAAAGCVVGLLYGLQDLLFPVCGGYLIIAIALTKHLDWAWLRHHDYSYGIYIYSFPIQQMLIASLPLAKLWWGNLLLATPLVLTAAFLSWHYVEKPALALKASVPRRLFAFADSAALPEVEVNDKKR